MKTFYQLGLIPNLIKALEEANYQEPTPIQETAIPLLLENRDILGTAQTGTGKTAAFALPILQLVYEARRKNNTKLIRALVLTPTRELAMQVAKSFKDYAIHLNIKITAVFGGVSKKPQAHELSKGVDILVATPGRLLDLINDGVIDLSNVNHFVLDEADQMLDMGFFKEVRKILPLLQPVRNNMLFSATMPKEVLSLANAILVNPERIEITPQTTTLETVNESVYHVRKKNKSKLLIHLLNANGYNQVLVFVRTKRNVDVLVRTLNEANIKCDGIHGNKSQASRTRALEDFKKGKIEVLVATDIAARGIDIIALPYVYNYDLPDTPEAYIHRIGRTARAGLSGQAISFCDPAERHLLRDIQKHTGQNIPKVEDHPYVGDPEPSEERIANEGRYRKTTKRENEQQGRQNRPKKDRRSGNPTHEEKPVSTEQQNRPKPAFNNSSRKFNKNSPRQPQNGRNNHNQHSKPRNNNQRPNKPRGKK